MALHNEIGNKGEEIAVEFLIGKGYKVLETNWRFRKSEIDIIAKKGNNLVFVEVKTRTSSYYQQPEESVTIKKQKQLLLGANEYSQYFDENITLRFDIVSIILKETADINHIKDAFYPIA